MIVKNHSTGKYMIIKKTTNHDYFEQIIALQYNINIHMPKMNQVSVIQNNIQLYYYK